MEHKQVIVIRKDLNMRKGKMVAQGAHASMAAILNLCKIDGDSLVLKMDARTQPWLTGRFKKVVVSVNSEQELLDIYNAAREAGLICSLIKDAGLTEFNGVATLTAVAVGPDREDLINAITGKLSLL